MVNQRAASLLDFDNREHTLYFYQSGRLGGIVLFFLLTNAAGENIVRV